MDAGSDHGSAAKGSAVDLEATGYWSGLVGCHFPFSPHSLPCVFLYLVFNWHYLGT